MAHKWWLQPKLLVTLVDGDILAANYHTVILVGHQAALCVLCEVMKECTKSYLDIIFQSTPSVG